MDASPLLLFASAKVRRKVVINMTKREEYEYKTEQLLAPIMEENNYELVDVEYVKEVGNWYLRVYIDKEGGITLEDCEFVSRKMNDLLDEHDYIADAYIFEVSSPGLGRQLKKDKDFKRSIGQEVEIKLYKAMNKQKEIMGYLMDFDDENLLIELENEEQMEIKRSDIAVVKLAVHF